MRVALQFRRGPLLVGMFLPLASLLLCALAFGRAKAAQPTDTTICQLVKHPQEFNKKVVRVRALVESDGIEHTVLLDESCESQGVVPWVSRENSEHSDIEKLHDAIFRRGRPGTTGKRITGVFTGTFSWHRRKIPSRVLALKSVADLHVQIGPGKNP